MTQREVFEWRRREVADRIIADPEHFNMNTWGAQTSCGTTACLAGHAILLAEEQGECEAIWQVRGGVLMLDGVKVHRTGLFESTEEFAMDFLDMPNGYLFHELRMGAEEAAKALLDEPYYEVES